MRSIAAFIPNLMDRSRFPNHTTFITSAVSLAEVNVDLIVVDLARCENMSDFIQPGVETIGFGPHVDSELADRARSAGYTTVLTRSVFFNRLESLLG